MSSAQILIRCDGSHTVGLGHVVRCLALAEELRGRHDVDCAFALGADELAAEQIVGHGFPFFTNVSGCGDYAIRLKNVFDFHLLKIYFFAFIFLFNS